VIGPLPSYRMNVARPSPSVASGAILEQGDGVNKCRPGVERTSEPFSRWKARGNTVRRLKPCLGDVCRPVARIHTQQLVDAGPQRSDGVLAHYFDDPDAGSSRWVQLFEVCDGSADHKALAGEFSDSP
jgi:hypothetical protein